MEASATDGVLIAGAGPVGLVTALGLARSGVPVTVLEAEAAIVPSPRAMVYHWSVLDGLDELGVLDDVQARGLIKQDYAFRVHRTGELVPYSLRALTGDTSRPYNVHLGQDELARIVLEHLGRLPGVTVRWSHRVTGVAQDGEGVTVTTEEPGGAGGTWRAAWLLGADGARSAVRHALGLGFPGMTWPERFVATNVRYPFDDHGFPRSTFQIDDVHGAVIVKIDETGLWRCTYAEDGRLPEETVAHRVGEHYAALLPGGGDYELVALRPYRMHQRAAETFRRGRALLLGDAAHATNPTGGLGLTTGLFDAFSLWPALSSVIVEGDDPVILDAWAADRRRVFWELTSPAATENKRIIYSEPDPEQRRRDLEAIRAWTSDPGALRERLLFTARLATHDLPAQ